jgi:hypothetical protein
MFCDAKGAWIRSTANLRSSSVELDKLGPGLCNSNPSRDRKPATAARIRSAAEAASTPNDGKLGDGERTVTPSRRRTDTPSALLQSIAEGVAQAFS